jgi:hypothetical protein
LYDNIYTILEHYVTLKTIEEAANAQPEQKRERGIEIAALFNQVICAFSAQAGRLCREGG